jgi:NAD(P)-dependent dehydrogenase (short-subunit alcohol dehydrogenase family)
VCVFGTARSQGAAETARQTLASKGASLEFLQLDVTNYEAVETLANDFRRRGITIDIPVNNTAAFLDKSHNVLNVPFSMIKETLEINALAPFAFA